jgi:hypothetical protein
LGITQTELAEWIGVSYPRLNEIIHGKRGVGPDTALRLRSHSMRRGRQVTVVSCGAACLTWMIALLRASRSRSARITVSKPNVPSAYKVQTNRKALSDAEKWGGKRPFKWMIGMATATTPPSSRMMRPMSRSRNRSSPHAHMTKTRIAYGLSTKEEPVC